jgi:hypothetical protein
MSLPRTSLPISEYRSVVALQALIDNRLPHYLKDLMLGGCLASDVIKGEGRSIDSLVRHKRNLLVPYLSNAFISEIRACKSAVQALYYHYSLKTYHNRAVDSSLFTAAP